MVKREVINPVYSMAMTSVHVAKPQKNNRVFRQGLIESWLTLLPQATGCAGSKGI
jgi:hypothetical protein